MTHSRTAIGVCLILLGVLTSAAQPAGRQTFVGVISDEMCGASHAAMRMGPTDGECAIACHLEHDADFVLVSGERVYKLSDQSAPTAHAGKRVKVIGTLDAASNTIRVESIASE